MYSHYLLCKHPHLRTLWILMSISSTYTCLLALYILISACSVIYQYIYICVYILYIYIYIYMIYPHLASSCSIRALMSTCSVYTHIYLLYIHSHLLTLYPLAEEITLKNIWISRFWRVSHPLFWVTGTPFTHVESLLEILGTPEQMCSICTGTPLQTCWKFW